MVGDKMKAKSSIKLQTMPKRSKAEQNKIDEQLETDWDKEIAKRRRTDRKAKSSNLKCWEFNIPIDREEFGEKCYKQGKKDADITGHYKDGFKNGEIKARKQTLEEVLKIVDAKYPDGMYSGEILNKLSEWLEQKLKAME